MEEAIIKKAQQLFIRIITKDAPSILTINYPLPQEKHIRNISLQDRIPSKKFAVIIAYMKSDADKEKLTKYYKKFNKYFVILNARHEHITSDTYPFTGINISHTPLLASLQQYKSLTAKYKEFDQKSEHVASFARKHLLSLEGIVLDANQYDIAVYAASQNEQEQLIRAIQNKAKSDIIHTFHSMLLETYAAGIDTRNVRFQNNVAYVLSLLTKGYKTGQKSISIIKKRLDIATQKGIHTVAKHVKKIAVFRNKQENAKQLQQAQIIPSISAKVVKPSHTLLDNLRAYAQKIRVQMYINRHVPQLKQISYEEYLTKAKESFITNIQKRRTLQKFKLEPKISILMVIDDIDEIWINKSVRSIKDQTYKNWELVIIDNCSSRTYLKSYLSSLNDPRMKTFFYNSKKTFAECLSQAYKIAKGEYIMMLDEGDEIDIETLFYLVKEVNRDNSIEFIYSDEDKINEQGKRIQPFFKPAWDPTMILSYPYANHVFFARRELLDRIDAFKSYNIQEPLWDTLLKIKDAAHAITHLPLILYHQRIRPQHKELPKKQIPDALKIYMNHHTIQGTIKHAPFPDAFYIMRKDLAQSHVGIVLFDNNIENINNFLQNMHINHKEITFYIGSTKQMPEHLPPNAQFYTLPTLSFSSAASTIAQHVDADYLLFLYSRLRPLHPDFLDVLISTSLSYEHTIVGTKIIDPDDIIQNSVYIKNLRHIYATLYEGQVDNNRLYDISVERECSAISRKCMLMKRTLFEDVPFDEQFDTHLQDIDVCIRAHKNYDTHILYTPDATLRTIYPYIKEKFSDKDTVTFMKKWGKMLEEKDIHVETTQIASIKA